MSLTQQNGLTADSQTLQLKVRAIRTEMILRGTEGTLTVVHIVTGLLASIHFKEKVGRSAITARFVDVVFLRLAKCKREFGRLRLALATPDLKKLFNHTILV
jgi:hypothetical protein